MNSTQTVRLDADLRRRLEQFRVEAGLETPSQVIRAALLLGLTRGEALDAAWRRAVATEAARDVSARMRKALQRELDEISK